MESRDETQMVALAGRYVDATNAGDIELLRSMYAANAVVWHNYDEVDVPIGEALAVLGWLRRTVPDAVFGERRVTFTPDGFVLRSVLSGTAPDGTMLRVPSCVLVTVDDDGRISRIEEYVDSSQLTALSRRS